MQKSPFLLALEQRRPLLLDGAMGTMLQASGLPAGVSPEEFCMERPDILRGIHGAYLEAGADIITSCTFGGNRFKLSPTLDVFRAVRPLWPATWAPAVTLSSRWATSSPRT